MSTCSTYGDKTWADQYPTHYHQPCQPKHGVIYPTDNKVTINGVIPDFTADVAIEVMVLTLDMGYPVGVQCNECETVFEEGDVVLAGQKRHVGWFGWHTRCLKGVLEDSPLDEFEITKNKLENGEDPFE